MNTKKQSIEETIEKIKTTTQRMKKAKQNNDQVGYEIALKEHEKLHKEYGHILYGKRGPTKIYEKRY